MKIVIDTKEDSREDIQKAIRMLSSLIGQEGVNNQGDIFSDDNKPVENGVFNIFGNSEAKTENGTTNSGKKEEDKSDLDIDFPELQEYR